ncbi:MAG TPA: RIP metalloprotease [Candidatus Limnocylindrales bacterium]|nr:RIP metalloprotease [Candidatus Limnocylindrales bacterium]
MELLGSISQTLVTIIIFVTVLTVIVVIHEAGHFFTARLARIRVHEFGIGFPPRAKVLASRGETIYTLNWLPIGGFVRLEGEDGDSDDPRSFVRAPLLVKVIVLVAGVAMNLVLAFVIFFAIALLATPRVGVTFTTVQPGSPAATVGLQPGERIDTVNGATYEAFGGRTAVDDFYSLAGQTVTLGVHRADGSSAQVSVALRSQAAIDAVNNANIASGNPDREGPLGISGLAAVPTGAYVGHDLVSSIQTGLNETSNALGLIANGLGQLGSSIINHPTERPPVTGPVGIAQDVGTVFWDLGPIYLLYIAALLSANLALVNILPFPPLDGGRVLFLLIRRVVGNRFSVRAEQLTYLAGFGLLMAFLVWITYFDLTNLGSGTP